MHDIQTFVRLQGRCDKCQKSVYLEIPWERYELVGGSVLGSKMLAESFLLNVEHECAVGVVIEDGQVKGGNEDV